MSDQPSTIKISNLNSEQILSNQKAYGIWGKYNRPFSSMSITEDPAFEDIYRSKIQSNNEFLMRAEILASKSSSTVRTSELDSFK